MTEILLLRGDDRRVCERCVVAASPLVRMRGLLGRKELPAGEGLLLRPASMIHTWFMRFPIDVAFLDDDFGVVAIRKRLRPWRAAWCRGAVSALELAAGECDRLGLQPGDQLVSRTTT